MRFGFLLGLVAVVAQEPPFPPRGAAAWVYDEKGGGVAEWTVDVAGFNRLSKTPLSTIFSYGGDMEYYPSSPSPFQTYFPASSQAAAAAYNSTHGVSYVILVIDGRMDGGQSYSPDLSKLTNAQLKEWADVTASLYCSVDVVDGIQLDLEPFAGKYVSPFLVFLAELSANLRSPERNCVSADHPNGRSITTFMFAGSVTPAVWQALGPNGFVTVSGYDLSQRPAGTPSSVTEYRTQLAASLVDIAASAAAHNGSFMVGVPAAASAHEFQTCTLANGTVIDGQPQISYITAALKELAAGAADKPGYLGPALWGFSSEMAIQGSSFSPANPFVESGEKAFLAAHL
jgi:hypothetical protein